MTPRMDRWLWRPSPGGFIVLAALTNATLYQRPLYTFATGHLDGKGTGSALTLLTVFLLVTFVTCAILGALALVSGRLLRPFCVVAVIGNAVALHFVERYGAVLDKSMLGNVFETDWREAASFLHPGIAANLAILALPPLIVLLRTRIQPVTVGTRARFLAIVMGLGLGGGYASASRWLWIDLYARQLGGLTMPWSYLINAGRYAGSRMLVPRKPELLPPATFADDRKTIVLLVIGESARAANFSLYGYERPTNPRLSGAGVIALNETTACATYTSAAVRCILSPTGSSSGDEEPLPSYLHRFGTDVIWRTNNWGEPAIDVTTFERAADLRPGCIGDDCRFDDILLHGLEARLRASARARILVVLHQHGSHGPDYHSRYPDRLEQFRPACGTVDLQRCSMQELVNAYDDTILYTDDFLARAIALLRRFDDARTAMLYISDHGESLGEHGLYLHGTPRAFAPEVQKNIPFLVWMSDAFRESMHASDSRLRDRPSHSQANVFHSVMGAFGMRSPAYDPDLDVFAARLAGSGRDSLRSPPASRPPDLAR